MRYPTISRANADVLVGRFAEIGTNEANVNTETTWVGSGDDVDLGPLDRVSASLAAEFEEFQQGDEADRFEAFEGRAAGRLHVAMRDLPIAVLDDPGFWRYVSLAKFWWFIRFREAKPIATGNHMAYVDGTRPTECVPLRMFLRAQAVRDGDDYSIASSMDRATDFWRSHVLRVQTASVPAMSRSFARLQAEKPMPTESQLRPFARQVNRLWANVVLHTLDEAEATQLLDEIYEAGPGSAGSAGPTP